MGAGLERRQAGTNSRRPHGQEQLRIVGLLVVFDAMAGIELTDG